MGGGTALSKVPGRMWDKGPGNLWGSCTLQGREALGTLCREHGLDPESTYSALSQTGCPVLLALSAPDSDDEYKAEAANVRPSGE